MVVSRLLKGWRGWAPDGLLQQLGGGALGLPAPVKDGDRAGSKFGSIDCCETRTARFSKGAELGAALICAAMHVAQPDTVLSPHSWSAVWVSSEF